MTDKEIIKYFNLCLKYDNGCKDCGFKGEVCDGSLQGKIKTLKMVSDLINRQQAEIERLNNNISAMAITLSNSAKETRAEAIKEFVERMKAKADNIGIDEDGFIFTTSAEWKTWFRVSDWCEEVVDETYKEMVGK
jgi:hypothetical protein